MLSVIAMGETTPNPGSDEAIELGCSCPVIDNGRGRGAGNGFFWINCGCPLHALYNHTAQKEIKNEQN